MLSKFKQMLNQRRARRSLYCTAAYWDSKADAYDDSAVSMWPNKALNAHYEKEQRDLVEKLVPDMKGLNVLDAGCGTGRLSRWFAQMGATVTGFDFSDSSIQLARRLSSGDNPAYFVGSIFDLDEEKKYDLIFSWGLVTVACRDGSELRQALGNMHKALKPSGRLVILEPIHKGFLSRVLDLSLEDFQKIMREAGFNIYQVTPMHFWPVRLFLAYIPWPGFISTPLYHLGQSLMKLPGLSLLGDYWGIGATPAAVDSTKGEI